EHRAVLVVGGISPRGLGDRLEIEGLEDPLDPLSPVRLAAHRHHLVFVDEDVEERLVGHDPEAAETILIKKAPVAPDAVENAIDAHEFVGDVGIDLAVLVVPEVIENRKDTATGPPTPRPTTAARPAPTAAAAAGECRDQRKQA